MERGCSASSDKTLHTIGPYCSQIQTSYWSVALSHSLPQADNPPSNRKWKTKSLPSLLITAPVCAKLALQEMMLPVLCSPLLLGVPDIRV
ncbi:hypothetical protein PBY51_020058 [Eleginops maclovinus]|uniref:Uncharacterized protein n=1 Tax=Eleginops maclovinus TaxID=56733 RepID=A0AAN7XLQ7_ELEMC|nr:hypothetical protein PBY51_020058 [Eleginops maclovinus]